MTLSLRSLDLDLTSEIDAIARSIRESLTVMRRRGAVVAVSGGIDSAVCAALCVHALGPDRVLTLLLPDHVSSPESSVLGRELAVRLQVRCVEEPIGSILDAAGCERHQAEAIRTVFPSYGPGWRSKISMPPLLDAARLNVPRIVVETPEGETLSARLPAEPYRQLVAATNFKQRVRTMLAYYHADAEHYAVCGTPNRLEYDQGFFVKGGDGLADFKPIAHLYKTQVYAVATELGVPESIVRRPPTTDTFSLAQSQEEFYFSVPLPVLDLCLYAVDNNIAPEEVAAVVGRSPDDVKRIFADIAAKRRNAAALHAPAYLVRPVGSTSSAAERATAG